VPKHQILARQCRAGVRLYTSFFNLAEPCVFIKQSPLPLLCHLHYLCAGHPFSEVTDLSCRVPLVLLKPFALVFSTNSPVAA